MVLAPEQIRRDNQRIKAESEEPNSAEALAWLQNRGEDVTCCFSANSEDMLADDDAIELVKMLYEIGAQAVTAVEIDGYVEDKGYQDTDKLIVTLPEDQTERKKLFAYLNHWARRRGWDAEPDLGRNYLLM